MLSFFTDLQLLLLASAVAFVAGVVLSTRVKDKLIGVPAELRTALNGAQASGLSALKTAQANVKADVIAKILPGATQPKAAEPAAPAPAPAAPAAPVAAEPAPAAPAAPATA